MEPLNGNHQTFLHNLPVFLSQWMHDDDVNDIRLYSIMNIKCLNKAFVNAFSLFVFKK